MQETNDAGRHLEKFSARKLNYDTLNNQLNYPPNDSAKFSARKIVDEQFKQSCRRIPDTVFDTNQDIIKKKTFSETLKLTKTKKDSIDCKNICLIIIIVTLLVFIQIIVSPTLMISVKEIYREVVDRVSFVFDKVSLKLKNFEKRREYKSDSKDRSENTEKGIVAMNLQKNNSKCSGHRMEEVIGRGFLKKKKEGVYLQILNLSSFIDIIRMREMKKISRKSYNSVKQLLFENPHEVFGDAASEHPFCGETSRVDLLLRVHRRVKIFAIEFKIDSVHLIEENIKDFF